MASLGTLGERASRALGGSAGDEGGGVSGGGAGGLPLSQRHGPSRTWSVGRYAQDLTQRPTPSCAPGTNPGHQLQAPTAKHTTPHWWRYVDLSRLLLPPLIPIAVAIGAVTQGLGMTLSMRL